MQAKANGTKGSNFLDQADYITDKKGNIKSIVLDYESFKKIEEILLDYGLGKAMEEVIDDEEVNLETAKKLTDFEK
ncbi:MAG TPA: hypothetical protein VKN82_02365 [Desulfohalobiaceae bacterium]|nr:hypothetical protein [Desulfohalobiaceae bacterium]